MEDEIEVGLLVVISVATAVSLTLLAGVALAVLLLSAGFRFSMTISPTVTLIIRLPALKLTRGEFISVVVTPNLREYASSYGARELIKISLGDVKFYLPEKKTKKKKSTGGSTERPKKSKVAILIAMLSLIAAFTNTWLPLILFFSKFFSWKVEAVRVFKDGQDEELLFIDNFESIPTSFRFLYYRYNTSVRSIRATLHLSALKSPIRIVVKSPLEWVSNLKYAPLQSFSPKLLAFLKRSSFILSVPDISASVGETELLSIRAITANLRAGSRKNPDGVDQWKSRAEKRFASKARIYWDVSFKVDGLLLTTRNFERLGLPGYPHLQVDKIEIGSRGTWGPTISRQNVSLKVSEMIAGSCFSDTVQRRYVEGLLWSTEEKKRATLKRIVTKNPKGVVTAHGICTDCIIDHELGETHVATAHVILDEMFLALEPLGLSKRLLGLSKLKDEVLIPKKPTKTTVPQERASPRDITSPDGHGDTKTEEERGSWLLRFNPRVNKFSVCLLTHEPMGEADTRAFFLNSAITKNTHFCLVGKKMTEMSVTVDDIGLYHQTQWSLSRPVYLREFSFTNDSLKKVISTDGLEATWTVDLQNGLNAFPEIIAPLKPAKKETAARKISDAETFTDAEIENEAAAKPKSKFIDELQIVLKDTKASARFPDGPSASASVEEFGPFRLHDAIWNGKGATWIVADQAVGYVKEVQMINTFVGFDKNAPKQIRVHLRSVRIVQPHEWHYGMRWADFNVRLKAYLTELKNRKLAAGIPPKPKSLLHLYFTGEDAQAYIMDHPLDGFLTKYLPLMQDENNQRIKRDTCLDQRFAALTSRQLERIQVQVQSRKLAQDSDIWIKRVQTLKEYAAAKIVAPTLPPIDTPPLAKLTIKKFNFAMDRDEELIRRGTEGHMEYFFKIDDYTGPKREIVGDPKSWIALGFRKLDWTASGVMFQLKDFSDPVLEADFHLSGTFGFGVQKTVLPYATSTVVAMGERTVAKITKGLNPAKIFFDASWKFDNVRLRWDTSFMPAFMRFLNGLNRYSPLSREKSPAMPIFDVLRLNMHGKFDFDLSEVVARVSASPSPYAKVVHHVDLYINRIVLALTRYTQGVEPMIPTLKKGEISHCMLYIKRARIRPEDFSPGRKSEINVSAAQVLLFPEYYCKSGDSSDHYIHPFPKPGGEYVSSNIWERVKVLPEIGLDEVNRIKWSSPLYDMAETHDSYGMFRSTSLNFGVNFCLSMSKERKQMGPKLSYPECDSVIYSDAITTMARIARFFTKPIPACRPAPRFFNPMSKLPPKESFGSLLNNMQILAMVSNINVSLWNNLEPGHGLHIYLQNAGFTQEQEKELVNEKEVTTLRYRSALVNNLEVGMSDPEMDIGANRYKQGFLLSAEVVEFTGGEDGELGLEILQHYHRTEADIQGGDEPSKASLCRVKTADHSEFSRGKSLHQEKLMGTYDMDLTLSGVRYLWTPSRRNSLWDWPIAFKEKRYLVQSTEMLKKRAAENALPFTLATGIQQRNYLNELLEDSNKKDAGISTDDPSDEPLGRQVKDEHRVFRASINRVELMFGSTDSDGIGILEAADVSFGVIKRKVTEGKSSWMENNYRTFFNGSHVYTRRDMNFVLGDEWVPKEAAQSYQVNFGELSKATAEPFHLSLNYSSAAASDDDDGTDTLKPSLLNIHSPDMKVTSSSPQFFIITRVISKVLMPKHPSTISVQNELAALKFEFLRSGVKNLSLGKLSEDIECIRTVIRQFEYACETNQPSLLAGLIKNGDEINDVNELRKKYTAKAKALVTLMSHDKKSRGKGVLYPSMFLVYSFGRMFWKLIEHRSRNQLIEVRLTNVVCRNTMYLGPESCQEYTFENITVYNLIHDALYGTLLSVDHNEEKKRSRVKSTDGKSVAFRFYGLQSAKVGGIPVFDETVINVSPLTVKLTYSTVKQLLRYFKSEDPKRGGPAKVSTSKLDISDVEIMREREARNKIFKYAYIGPISITASFKYNDHRAHPVDFEDFKFESSPAQYSSREWSFGDLFKALLWDVVIPMGVRGGCSLVGMKLFRMKVHEDPEVSPYVGALLPPVEEFERRLSETVELGSQPLAENSFARRDLDLKARVNVAEEEEKRRHAGLLVIFGSAHPLAKGTGLMQRDGSSRSNKAKDLGKIGKARDLKKPAKGSASLLRRKQEKNGSSQMSKSNAAVG